MYYNESFGGFPIAQENVFGKKTYNQEVTIKNTISHLRMAYQGNRYTEFSVDSSGNLNFSMGNSNTQTYFLTNIAFLIGATSADVSSGARAFGGGGTNVARIYAQNDQNKFGGIQIQGSGSADLPSQGIFYATDSMVLMPNSAVASAGTQAIKFYAGGSAATQQRGNWTSTGLFLGGGTATTAATAYLHLAAGTATASTAPIKLTSGTNLTTAEAGAVEYNGVNLLFTPTGTIRKTVPTVVTGRSTAQTAAVATVVTQTVGAADATYLVSANVNITTATLFNFVCQVDYTDETNTARTDTFNFSTVGGVLGIVITNATGTVPYEGLPLHIRCKAATTITIKTANGGGTNFTTVTYNVEAQISQIG